MRRRVLSALTILVVASAPAAAAPPAFLDTGFGPASGGLELAVAVDGKGEVATFRVKNVGSAPVTFVEQYSCSGTSMWSIASGASEAALDHYFSFDANAHGLTTHVTTVCTRNGPTKLRTVGKGATVTIAVPFANAGEILESKDTVFRAEAELDLKGSHRPLVLHGAAQTR